MDIVERLRTYVACDGGDLADVAEAADEIERLRLDAARLEWLQERLFMHSWNGVIGGGSRTNWRIAGDYRHTTAKMVSDDFRAAIDAAMKG